MAVRRAQVLGLIGAVILLIGLASWGIVTVLGRAGELPEASVSVEAKRPDGGAPSDADLDRARQVLLTRMRAANVEDPRVDRNGDRLVLRGRGAGETMLRELVGTGQLRFRRVLATVFTDQPMTGTLPEQPADAPRPAVADRLGEAYTAAAAVQDVDQGKALPPSVTSAFSALSAADVATLPLRMQLLVPGVTCAQLTDVGAVDQSVVACDKDGTKYLLDKARVTGADIDGATATLGPSGQWTVNVRFTADGQRRFTELSRELAPQREQVGIVLDALVVSAPAIQAEITGEVQVSGNLSQYQTEVLAAQLAGGELPVRLTVIG
ncbi:hypothetical protein ABZS66_44230 [Dactylosporangium sp. NPDC005572]|uniref:SecDF P1 head subdomain-containing protein n=1 Tax=Dactylosporangium sp. NPDC005572 TaxID=3156889 RepID=UPI0033B70F8F